MDRPALGMLLLRLFAGLSLALAHGLGKVPPSAGFIEGVGSMGFPMPVVFAWGSGLAEFAGGILLALGLFTRPAAALIVANMAVAVVIRHAGDPYGNRELAMLFGVIALMFLLTGPGRYSVDARLGARDG
jgi:putative oxidoreductase